MRVTLKRIRMLVIPRKLGKVISKCLLDWAEPLPPFKGTIISRLQQDRAEQRKDSDEWQAMSAPSPEVNLTYLQFRLIEVCSAERIATIKEAVEEVVTPTFPDEDEHDFITSPTFTAGAWRTLGMLRPNDGKRKTSPSPGWGTIPLPDEVQRIHLSVHKVLPTTFLLTADVYLTSQAHKQLQAVQAQKYLSLKVYTGIQRIPALFLSGTTTSAAGEQQKAHRRWMDKCREATARVLNAQFPAMFLPGDDRSSAPAIDIFSLSGVPSDDNTFSTWLNDDRMFLTSVGDQMLSFHGYKSDHLVISMPSGPFGQPNVWRLYILKDAKLLCRDTESTREICDHIHVWLALLHSARRTDRVVHDLQVLSAKARHSWGMRKHFRLYRELVTTSAQLSRLSLDLAECSVWLQTDYLATFKQITVPGVKPVGDIGARLPAFTKRYLESVAKYAKSELEGIRDEVAWRNMRWIYWLQIAVLFVSSIAVYFAYAGLQQPAQPLAPQELHLR